MRDAYWATMIFAFGVAAQRWPRLNDKRIAWAFCGVGAFWLLQELLQPAS